MTEMRNGIGPVSPRLVLIGEAYGQEEERAQEPWVGKAGQFLDKFLQRVGLRRDETYLTNVCNARPSNGSNDISPLWSARSGFTPDGALQASRLHAELSRLPPSCVLVPLGNVALDALIGRRDITVSRGYPWKWQGRTVIPSLHPSYLMRGQFAEMPLLQWDLEKALRWKEQPEPVIHLARTIGEVGEALRQAANAEEVGFDIEAVATEGEMTCFSLCWEPNRAVSVPYGGFWNGKRETIRVLLQELLEAAEGPRIVTQNGNFDTFFLERYLHIRTNLSRLDDTMIAHHVIYPALPKSLRLFASVHTNLPFWKDDSLTARQTGDFDLYQRYNAMDSLATLQVWQRMKQLLGSNGLRLTYDLTMQRLPYAQGMQRVGMAVDFDRLIRLRKENREQVQAKQIELEQETRRHNATEQDALTQRRNDLAAQVAAAVERWKKENARRKAEGLARVSRCEEAAPLRKELSKLKAQSKTLQKGFNPRSHKQSVSLFQSEGLKVSRNRKTGNVSVGAKALEAAAKKGSRVAGLMQTIRELRTEYDNYLTWNTDPIDGRFRYSANIRGTETGRISTSILFFYIGSNPQSFSPAVRSVLKADSGGVFVNVDLPGAEWVVTAHLTGCEKMLLATRSNIHAYTAHLMTGLSYDLIVREHRLVGDERDPEQIARLRASNTHQMGEEWQRLLVLPNLPRDGSIRQQLGKRPGLALNYRMGWHEYAEQTGQTAREAKEQVERYHAAYPGLLQWWKEVEMQVSANRYVETLQGTIVPMMGAVRGQGAEQTFKSAIAAIPQGTIANHTHSAGVKLSQRGFDLRMNGHDSLLIQLRRDAQVFQQLREIVGAFDVPLRSKHGEFRLLPEVKVGLNWGPRDAGNPVGLRDVQLTKESVESALNQLSHQYSLAR